MYATVGGVCARGPRAVAARRAPQVLGLELLRSLCFSTQRSGVCCFYAIRGTFLFFYSSTLVLEFISSAIMQSDEWPDTLQLFLERFIDRFVEIAVGDVDEGIALVMLTAFRHLHR